jgi:hypothetical protein
MPVSAQRAAALGLAFGLRIASGPLERTGAVPLRSVETDMDAVDPSRTARSVAAWRQCQREQAMHSSQLELRVLKRAGGF